MLFIDPGTLAVMILAVPLIVGASFIGEKLFGPPKK